MRTLEQHRDDCRAVANLVRGWNTEWWITGKIEYRRKNGYANGHCRGQIFGCNSRTCGARIWVSDDEILTALGLTHTQDGDE